MSYVRIHSRPLFCAKIQLFDSNRINIHMKLKSIRAFVCSVIAAAAARRAHDDDVLAGITWMDL